MRYKVIITKQFKKDVRRLEKSGKDLSRLRHVVSLLEEGKTLEEPYRDHLLRGKLKGRRECHIAPDWLLLYKKDHDRLILLLLKTGDHRHVLGVE
jgi:mRNA interferase YafQ